MDIVRKRAVISGMVQGVFFRAHTQEKARELGLVGWVKNRPDGSVEAVFEGTPGQVEAMIKWCHEGPSTARISKVTVKPEEPTGRCTGFEIR